MSKKDHDKLKSLLRNLELPATPQDFTTEVMHEVTTLSSEDRAGESRLKDVLQLSALPIVPSGFTDTVIGAIGKRGPAGAAPVIGKGGWISAAAFILICVIFGSFPTGSANVIPRAYTLLGTYIAQALSRYDEAVIYLIATGPAAALLLGIERILRKRIENKNALAY